MNYTKGEWKAIIPDYNSAFTFEVGINTPNFYKRIATLDTHPGLIDFDEKSANAHLISAAPDMYEALKEATEIISDMVIKYGAGIIPSETPVIKRFKKALDKAEGR